MTGPAGIRPKGLPRASRERPLACIIGAGGAGILPRRLPDSGQSWTRIRYFDADQNSSGCAISTLPVTLPSLLTVEVR